MEIYIVDGTFELFRAWFSYPPRKVGGREVGATIGFMKNLSDLLIQKKDVYIAVAFDHVIESFRNKIFSDYKTGEGIEKDLYAQFSLVEQATVAMGVVCWPMIEFEADDAIATASHLYKKKQNKIIICSPDKDLCQCVQPGVVTWDRIRGTTLDEKGVQEKFGVLPQSIPDYLALVGDSADGVPGIKGWGAKSASTVLARFLSLENIPDDPKLWPEKIRGKDRLAQELNANKEKALLYRTLTTLRSDVPLTEKIEDLLWKGPTADLKGFCQSIGETRIVKALS